MTATRNPSRVERTSTEYQVHSANTTGDFTEKRLNEMIKNASTGQQKMLLEALLHDYLLGVVAVAWKSGAPVYIRVTKE